MESNGMILTLDPTTKNAIVERLMPFPSEANGIAVARLGFNDGALNITAIGLQKIFFNTTNLTSYLHKNHPAPHPLDGYTVVKLIIHATNVKYQTVVISGPESSDIQYFEDPTSIATPAATPTIEAPMREEIKMSVNSLMRTIIVECPVALQLPANGSAGQPNPYEAELSAVASKLQKKYFSEGSMYVPQGYRVTRLKSHVTNNGEPLAKIVIKGSTPADIEIVRY